MICKTDFKVKTTFVAIFTLAFIAIACMACFSCANDIEYVYEESISLMAMPDKTEYVVGDTLDLTGLAVTSIGKDGNPVLLPDSAFTVEPPHGTPLDEAGTQTVTVSHGKRSLTFPIKVAQESLCLYVKTPPRRAYYAGERLDLSGLALVLRENGTETLIEDFSSVSSEPENGAVLSVPADAEDASRATRTVELSYRGLRCSFDISIRAVRLVDLYVKSLPARTNYYTGGTLDLAGLELAAAFSDGTAGVVTDYTVVKTPDFAETGAQTVTVSYLDKEVSFSITVFGSYLAFSEQPQDKEIALYAENETLSAKIIMDGDGELHFIWYRKNPGEADFSEIARTELERVGFLPVKETVLVLPKNNFVSAEYYCVATLTANGNIVRSARSNTARVTQRVETGLPVVRIDTENGADVVSKEDWMKNASLSLSGASEEGWNFSPVTTSIRGRGNSTWGQPKKPYALKLDKKREIMGMPGHKRWVLIANYLDNSFMRNCMAFYLSRQLGADYTVRGEFVMLILNDECKGLYWLGEAIKPDKNRVDIDEDEDYLIELDVYYDEVWKFRSAKKNLPYMIKNDDTMSDERLESLREKITAIEQVLYPEVNGAPDESYTQMLDIDSWAKFYLVNELMSNGELGHPKSCYLTLSVSELRAGPVWDFDWASLSQTGCTLKSTLYYDALFDSPAFKGRLKEIWRECYGNINIGEEIECLRKMIYKAQGIDAAIWGAHLDPSGISRDGFDAYVDFLKETLCKKYAVVDNMIQQL